MGRALLLVDPQCDFIDGSLPVPRAAQAMDRLAEYIKSRTWDLGLITVDHHPWNHCSFVDNGGQWPRHCVAHSAGAAIWPSLLEPFYRSVGEGRILRKGASRDKDEYSIWAEPSGRLALTALIRAYGIDNIDICGLAGDICVLNTLKDGVAQYSAGMFNVLPEFSPSLDGGKALRDYCDKEHICAR